VYATVGLHREQVREHEAREAYLSGEEARLKRATNEHRMKAKG